MQKLYLVIPCYNEEEVLPETSKQLRAKMETLMAAGKISKESRIVFVNDGSKDRTWEIIESLHKENPLFQGIKLSRNKGHQNALLAGLMTVKEHCDMAISMDADLQDDIDAIDGMLEKYAEGCDIVYGVRNARDTDTAFKRKTAEGYYKVMRLLGADIVYNHADYRLMSKRALDGLEQFKEVNLFLRGVVPMIGYKSDKVYYARKERFELVEVFDRPMLFTCLRVDRNTVPKGLYLYEVRNDDDQCGIPVEIGRWIMVNHWGTLLSATPIKLEPNRYNNNAYRHIDPENDWNYTGDLCSAREYMDKYLLKKDREKPKER